MGHLILRVVTKVLIAPILLFALYVQWHGDYGPGGGFQAGVIFAVGFVLYAIVFGLEAAQKAAPPTVLKAGAAIGVLIYAGVGVATMLMGGNYLDYDVLVPDSDHHAGQHYGIIIVEFGVGVTVACVMALLFYAFAGREPEINEGDW